MEIRNLRKILQGRGLRLAFKIVLGCMVAFIALTPLLVPPALRWAVQTQASDALGRKVTLKEAGFNPFKLSATLRGLQIGEEEGGQDFVRIDLVRVNLSLASIWYRGLVLDALRIEHPYVHVERQADNRFNFNDIVQKFSAAAPVPAQPKEPFHFSVSNIELTDGQIIFDDKPVQRLHKIDHLNIGVPFVSNLPARVQTFVQPHLEANVNGVDFRLSGDLKPFSDHHEASLQLAFAPIDLTQYLVYVPGGLPIRIERAKFSSDVHLVWSSASGTQASSLALSGKLGLQDVSIKDLKGGQLVAAEGVSVDLARVEPLATPLVAQISSVRLDAPRIRLERDRSGTINFSRLGTRQTPETTVASAPAAKPVQDKPAQPPRVSIGQFEVTKGELAWSDQAVVGGFHTVLKEISLQLRQFDLAADAPAELGARAVGEHGEKVALQAQLAMKPGKYDGHVSLSGFGLADFRPYYAQYLGAAHLGGQVQAEGNFAVAPATQGTGVTLDAVSLDFRDVRLGGEREKQPQISLPATHLGGIRIDLAKREAVLGEISSRSARLKLERGKDGQLSLVQLLQQKRAPATVAAPAAPVVKGGETRAAEAGGGDWHLELGELALQDWALHFTDSTGRKPVSLDIADLGLKIRKWSNAPRARTQAELSAKVNKAGRLALQGSFGTQPLQGAVHADIRDVDFVAVQPYVDDLYRILVTRGRVSARGDLNFDLSNAARPDVRYRGNLVVSDFNSLDRLNHSDFMRWKLFSLTGVSLQTQPLALTTQEVRLDDFYSRLILDEKGRLNVRELAASDEDEAAEDAAGSVPAGAASQAAVPQAHAAALAAPPVKAPAVPFAQVRIGKITLSDGHINYSDRFVKPNYEANLLAVNGGLSGLSSDQSSVAQLNLSARMDGAAPVSVSGELNPFRQDGFLDIKADVRDVDLVGASPYSAKYVGYGIAKGKLSMSVQYKVRDRELTAQNHVTLDQLTFGRQVESPEATKLPVLFAVALLKDRHGVIDVNLPISGSLDDPQFSVGGVIVRVIMNLVSKAVTAPFSLIGSLFGGGEELSYLDFASGSGEIRPEAGEKLRTLAKALVDRPALKLEIAGHADPVADATGLKRARLDSRLRMVKAQSIARRGESVEDIKVLAITPAEYPALLTRVYESSKIDARPRNALGLLKTLPVAEMERIVLASYVISDDDLNALADQRAQAVRSYLLDQAGIAADRIFLLSSEGASAPVEGKPAQSRVEFRLR